MAGSRGHDLEFTLAHDGGVFFLTLVSPDGTNRLTRRKVMALAEKIEDLAAREDPVLPLVISGDPTFSAGADLNEISRLNGPEALAFAEMGQAHERGRALPRPLLRGNRRLLHGRRT